jgi:hypothetical protein
MEEAGRQAALCLLPGFFGGREDSCDRGTGRHEATGRFRSPAQQQLLATFIVWFLPLRGNSLFPGKSSPGSLRAQFRVFLVFRGQPFECGSAAPGISRLTRRPLSGTKEPASQGDDLEGGDNPQLTAMARPARVVGGVAVVAGFWLSTRSAMMRAVSSNDIRPVLSTR